jgi:hypothetical protein
VNKTKNKNKINIIIYISQWSFKFGSQFILVFCGGHELIVFELKSSLFMSWGRLVGGWVGRWGARVWAGGEGEGIIIAHLSLVYKQRRGPKKTSATQIWCLVAHVGIRNKFMGQRDDMYLTLVKWVPSISSIYISCI